MLNKLSTKEIEQLIDNLIFANEGRYFEFGSLEDEELGDMLIELQSRLIFNVETECDKCSNYELGECLLEMDLPF